jgi:hypothetical protein
VTPEEIQAWLKVAGLVGGMVAPAYGVWVLLQKRVTDLEKREEAAKTERERQQNAWWEKTEANGVQIAELDKTCSNATTELRTMMKDLKERVDLHSASNVANLAGIVRNYNDMIIQTLDTMRETLRAEAKK